MKKLLMMTAALLALATPARADELPATFLGQWCQLNADDATSYYVSLEAKEECERADRLTIKRNELSAIESGCRFRSITRTKDLRANHTKPTKADWTPVTEILAHCEGEGVKSVVKMRLTYDKGSLMIESKILSEKNTY